MLALTRKNGQSIVIDHCITVTVVSAKDGSVRLAINADKSITVNRAEVESQNRNKQRWEGPAC